MFSRGFSKLTWSFVAAACSLALARHALGAYEVLDVGPSGPLDASPAFAVGLNEAGQVVGTTMTPDLVIHAFRTAPNSPAGPASDLGTLDGGRSFATAINGSGVTVGYGTKAPGWSAFQVGPSDALSASSIVGPLMPGGFAYAYDINDAGNVTGTAQYSPGMQAFRTLPNDRIKVGLGTLGGDTSIGYAINSSGQVVGSSTLSVGATHAFRTTASGNITAASDLSTFPGGNRAEAYGINDAGQAVGEATTVLGTPHAFRTTATGLIDAASDLGTLGGTTSAAYDINNLGQVVGTSATANDAANHAFFIGATGAMVDLNAVIPADSGWTLTLAIAINDSGQIAGLGDVGGVQHVFLLSPVPEPATAAVAAAALLATGVFGRRRVSRRTPRSDPA